MAKRQGRPRLPEAEKASINMTMRLRPDLADRLRNASAESKRSMSAEAEQRLIESLEEGPNAHLLKAIRNAIEVFERTTGKKWFDDEATSILALNTATAVLRAIMLPPGREHHHVVMGQPNPLLPAPQNISADFANLAGIIAHRPMRQILEAIEAQEKGTQQPKDKGSSKKRSK